MKTGVIEDHINAKLPSKRRIASSSGNAPTPGGSGGGNDDGADNYRDRNDFKDLGPEEDDQNRDKARVITWFLLIIVLMTFGGLIGAYVVIATNNVAEWKPFNLPFPIWISTGLILISSVVYHFAKTAVDAERHIDARKYLIATTVIGGVFIASQMIAWMALSSAGLYVEGNPYAGFFYILTGVHAVHVLGGIVALGAILLRVWNDTEFAPELEYRRNLARSVGYYWHFMGVLWLALVALLGFWK